MIGTLYNIIYIYYNIYILYNIYSACRGEAEGAVDDLEVAEEAPPARAAVAARVAAGARGAGGPPALPRVLRVRPAARGGVESNGVGLVCCRLV